VLNYDKLAKSLIIFPSITVFSLVWRIELWL